LLHKQKIIKYKAIINLIYNLESSMKYLILFSISLLPQFAHAQDVAAEGPGISSLVIQLLIIFAIFYFLIIRPQQKKLKDHQKMTSELSKGDKVITQGGVGAVVTSAKEGEKFIEVEIATGVKVNVLRSSVSDKLIGDAGFKLTSSDAVGYSNVKSSKKSNNEAKQVSKLESKQDAKQEAKVIKTKKITKKSAKKIKS
jgi:preprotein translocase subunit YajC